MGGRRRRCLARPETPPEHRGPRLKRQFGGLLGAGLGAPAAFQAEPGGDGAGQPSDADLERLRKAFEEAAKAGDKAQP